MKTQAPIQRTDLVPWIRSVFREGLVLTDDVARYMDSTFATQDLGAVLTNAAGSETGPLLELLCFPDRELQTRLTRAIARLQPPERRTAIRVRLRNAGLPWHAAQIRLMELFLGNMLMIDTICRALFGETRYFQRPGQDCLEVEQGPVQRRIQDVIRLLA